MSENLKDKAFGLIMSSAINLAIIPVHLEMNGNREAKVEGLNRIINYDENIIKISVKGMNISFNGRNLLIKCLTHDSLIIKGFIKTIEFHL